MTVTFNKFMALFTLAILLILIPGCSRDKQDQTSEKQEVAVTEKQEVVVTKKITSTQNDVTAAINGTVLEIVDTGSFIFVLLDREGKQSWATVPAVDIKVGEKVTLLYSNVMKNFHSKSMNRTFEELIFSSGIKGKSGRRRTATRSF